MSIENWTHYLLTQGAVIDQGRVQHFSGDIPAEKHRALHEHTLCDLSHYGLIRARGEEAQHFLQNQFCNDVSKVSDTLSQYNGYCTPKGRALAFFRLFQRDDQYYLRLPSEMLEAVLKRLRMYAPDCFMTQCYSVF